MSRQIIDYDEYPLLVNTFWMGKCEGVQITIAHGQYVQMSRANAMEFFELTIKRLEEQIESDKINPPWWQEMKK